MSLIDVPYIPLPKNTSANIIARMKGTEGTEETDLKAVDFLKDYFENGGREGFEQITDHKGEPGRWVFIGFDSAPPAPKSQESKHDAMDLSPES